MKNASSATPLERPNTTLRTAAKRLAPSADRRASAKASSDGIAVSNMKVYPSATAKGKVRSCVTDSDSVTLPSTVVVGERESVADCDSRSVIEAVSGSDNVAEREWDDELVSDA